MTGTTSVRIYNSIKNACLSMSEVKMFGLWNNQPSKQKEGDTKAIKYPAIYISFENEYNQLSAGRQEINGVFVLYICLSSLKHKDEEVLAFKDYVYQQLNRTLPVQGFSDFYRTFEVQDTDHDKSLLIWQQEYSYSYVCDVAADRLASTNFTFTLDTSFES